MRVNGKHYRTIWMEGTTVFMIDQNQLPFRFRIMECSDHKETCQAIKKMTVRGAGAIGAAAGFAMAQAFLQAPDKNREEYLRIAKEEIENTRPTARNLFYAVDRVFEAGSRSVKDAAGEAQALAEENIRDAKKIGEHGNMVIFNGMKICTHCNAGWLGFVDYGSALSVIYTARDQGKDVMVYVSETRPRGQGARLTAWELANEGIPHAVITDSACAHLAAMGKIDLFITGADRIARNGDTANKIGTLDKAIIAEEFRIPFIVAAPLSTFDVSIATGKEIMIEERAADELMFQEGIDESGEMARIRVINDGSRVMNPAFDITPAKYITGIATEKDIIRPGEDAIMKLFQSSSP